MKKIGVLGGMSVASTKSIMTFCANIHLKSWVALTVQT